MKRPRVRDYDKSLLRLPEGLRDEIKATAEQKGISMNTEMVARLQIPARDRLAQIEEKLDLILKALSP